MRGEKTGGKRITMGVQVRSHIYDEIVKLARDHEISRSEVLRKMINLALIKKNTEFLKMLEEV